MVHSSLQKPEDFNINKFYMWRCVVTMAHADGLVHDEERAYLHKIFDNMKTRAGLPQAHYDALVNDLDEPQEMMDMLRHINDPKYRSQVIYFARLLAYKDGDLHPSEEALLEKMHIHGTAIDNIDEIRKDVAFNVQEDLVIHESKMDAARPVTGLFGLVDQIALHFGIDLMDE